MPIAPGETHVPYTLAVLNAVGGVAAFAIRRSKPSLIGGAALAGAFGYSAHMIAEVDAYQGHWYAAGASAVLGNVGLFRLFATGNLMPGGLMAGLGLGALVYHGTKTAEWHNGSLK